MTRMPRSTTINTTRRSTHRAIAGTAALSTQHAGPWIAVFLSALLLALAAILFAAPARAAYDDNEGDAYGFVLRAEGSVLLAGLEQEDAVEAEPNHPLLTGDQITTSAGRTELVLPDGSVVRVDRGSSVVFEALAGSPDSELEGGTFLLLDDGKLQIRTPEVFYGGDDFAVQTPNATVYLGESGSYRLKTRGTSFTEVVVREGFAEADTTSGSAVARAGEALEISGRNRPFVDVVAAGPADALELWAGDLDQAAYNSRSEYVDPRLAYAAAPLDGAGDWIVVGSRRAWRPYVRADWRPFRHGRWVYTPSGLTWVPVASWGWVTSHYGAWDYAPNYGWLWYPGSYYQPAAVYWYWGPTHVGWIPYGYYSRYHYDSYLMYGWAGGSWGYWADWTFCPTRYFGRRGYDRYWDTGGGLAETRRHAVPRGIVTTDTRGLHRGRWGKPTELLQTLERRHARSAAGRAGGASGRLAELPDVTEFVAKRKLSDARLQEVRATRASSFKDRLRPLAEDAERGRLTTRSATDRGAAVRTQSGSSRNLSRDAEGNAVRSRADSGSSSRVLSRTESRTRDTAGRGSDVRDATPRASGVREPESRTRSTIRRPSGTADRGRVERQPTRGSSTPMRRPTGDTARDSKDRDEASSPRKRSLGRERGTLSEGGERGTRGGREGVSSLRARSEVESSAPARKVLERIRAHRETARETPSSKPDVRRPTSTTRGSTRRPPTSSTRSGSSSSKVSKGSSGSSSKGSASKGSSGSSTRNSGSSRSRVERSSPPPRRQSASNSRGRSQGKSSARARKPNS